MPFGSLPPAALLPVTTTPAALAAGDLDGLLPAATRPLRRQATATTATWRPMVGVGMVEVRQGIRT